MTELSPLATTLGPEDHWQTKHIGCVRGKPVANVEVRVVDEDDRVLYIDEIGEIIVPGHNVMKGYWRKPERAAKSLRGGWMYTGEYLSFEIYNGWDVHV